MSNEEKLRALLAEVRRWMIHGDRGAMFLHDLQTRIDAALAEPAGGCDRCETLRDLADKAAWVQGDAQRRMIKAQQERDEARAALEKEKAAHRLEREAHDRRFDRETKCMKERDEARAEIERLRGTTPELPPRPPDGSGLPRYGLRWNGPTEPVAVPMLDGYWTPWHLADAETQRFEIERKHTGRALDEAVALQKAACAAAYQRGAEAMREAAAKYFDDGLADGGIPGPSIYGIQMRQLPLPEDK
jgi:hypothetical protein